MMRDDQILSQVLIAQAYQPLSKLHTGLSCRITTDSALTSDASAQHGHIGERFPRGNRIPAPSF